MRLPGRFEWKILAVVLLVAALSAGTAGYALRFALRGVAGWWEHERSGPDPGGQAAEVFRAYFAARKDEFRRRADALAANPPARLADLASHDDLLRARLLEGDTVIEQWPAEEVPPEIRARTREAPPLLAELPGVGPEGRARKLELTFGIPAEMYDRFVDLTTALDAERRREQAYEAIFSRYLRDYFLFVVGLLAVVPFIGLYFARRATLRLARLRDAAQRVGEGDLTVRLAPSGRDELDDLARAFDGMVEELGDTRSRLEYLQKVSAWQEVARRLAHEIKNPLTPIQLAVQELAIKYQGDDPSYRRLLDTAVEILKEEITDLRRLVEDFSAFAKLPKVEPVPVDLGAFLSDFVRHHPEWQSYLEVVPPPTPLHAACDRTLFGRVLNNLVENAVQASQGAGTAPRVRLSAEARPARGRAVLVVEDNGPGVNAADRQRIFDPYITTKPQGTGLGLAIVRKIVIDHGGDISVSPSPSSLGGARFEVDLPAGDPTRSA
jgi:two-component system, NtrC family, nitrogen regulation sensor histidine kinase NtrY